MLTIFYPDKIDQELLEKIDGTQTLRIGFAYYNTLRKSELWNSFIDKIREKTIRKLHFYVRLDKDESGQYIKSWGEIDFLELVKGSSIDEIEIINAETLDNLWKITDVKTLSIRQAIKEKISLLPIGNFTNSLERLYIEKNTTDLYALNNLKKLKLLNVTSIKLNATDICDLEIETLELVKSTLVNAAAVNSMDSVEMISIYAQRGNDFSFLKMFPNLQSLVIDKCKALQDLSFIESLNTIEHITLENVPVIDNFSILHKLPNLKTFTHIDSLNKPEDYLELNKLNLEELNVYYKVKA